MLQIRMLISPDESARLMEALEIHGVVGPSPGGRKAREALIGVDQLEETLAALPQPRADS